MVCEYYLTVPGSRQRRLASVENAARDAVGRAVREGQVTVSVRILNKRGERARNRAGVCAVVMHDSAGFYHHMWTDGPTTEMFRREIERAEYGTR